VEVAYFMLLVVVYHPNSFILQLLQLIFGYRL
jgi:hypothetical protein